jgi:hypothetical protein
MEDVNTGQGAVICDGVAAASWYDDTSAIDFCDGTYSLKVVGGSDPVCLNGDNLKLTFGAAGNDFEIYHDGTNNYLKSTTGYLVLSSSKATTGDPTGVEGMIYINTNDNVVKIYADGAWRTLASW